MKKFQKITKTEMLILALTAAFLGTLGLTYARETASAPGADYTVTAQHAAAEPGAPEPENRVLVNINTAGAGELEALEGIGPALAQRIVEYREEHGPFRSVDELLEVKGIGEATLEKFRDSVILENTDEPMEEDNR